MLRNFFKEKLVDPIFSLMKQGLTVEKLSMSLTAGIVICCFPILGMTTILCVLAAHVFKLNHVAIQIANYFSYPLQLALIIPFLHAGNALFGQPKMHFVLSEMTAQFKLDALGFFEMYGGVALRACVAWAIFAPIAAVIVYYPLKYALKLSSRRSST